jgi:hypothetical protein
MATLNWADVTAIANSGELTVNSLTDEVARYFDGQDSRLCPGVPKRVIWSCVRLALENRTGAIRPHTELADVAALYLYEFQPSLEG